MPLPTEADLQCRNLIQKHTGEVRLVATRLCANLLPEEREAILAVAGDEPLCCETVARTLEAADLRRLRLLQAEHQAKGLTPPEGNDPEGNDPEGDEQGNDEQGRGEGGEGSEKQDAAPAVDDPDETDTVLAPAAEQPAPENVSQETSDGETVDEGEAESETPAKAKRSAKKK